MSKITIKTSEEIELMRISGQILAEVLEETAKRSKPGVSTFELDQFAEEFIRSKGGTPCFKGYHGFPGTLCASRNEEIVHTIPSKDSILEEGDLFTIDCGVNYKGWNTDAARSIGIGKISPIKQKLIDTAKEALSRAIKLAKPGTPVNELGRAIQEIIERNGFHVIRELTGHGIGKELHEGPLVSNFWEGTPGPLLAPGMTIAIEPIFAVSTGEMRTLSDNWTIVTADNSVAVQEENTILITPNGNEILTTLNR